MKEETEQAPSWKQETEQAPSWKQDSILGRTVDFDLYAQLSMETTHQLENWAPWMEEPQGSYLDSLLSKRIS